MESLNKGMDPYLQFLVSDYLQVDGWKLESSFENYCPNIFLKVHSIVVRRGMDTRIWKCLIIGWVITRETPMNP